MFKLLLLFLILSLPAFAQQKASKDPVEITSKILIVDQIQKTATFTGNVEAKQKGISVKSDKMIAYYTQTNDKNTKNTVSKIITIGNVVVDNQQQKATGNQGEYLVEKQLIELNGNVTLIKNMNIIKGDRLIYNLKTGKSELFSNSQKLDQPDDERVKAIFIPQDTDN
jgi:lipopolysaccharide export system protein LptA